MATYRVIIATTSLHEYVISDCNSSTVAEDIAQASLDDGEMGTVTIEDSNIQDCFVEEE